MIILTLTGGGLWQPEADSLRKLRREFDRRSNRIKEILKEDRIRKNFLGGVSTDEAKVVKAFVSLTSNASTALKRNPKVSLDLLTQRFSVTHPPLLHFVIPVEIVKLVRESKLFLNHVSRAKKLQARIALLPCWERLVFS
jgi:uncharacterized protein (DUF2461 family)